jgi:hypothetical protein
MQGRSSGVFGVVKICTKRGSGEEERRRRVEEKSGREECRRRVQEKSGGEEWKRREEEKSGYEQIRKTQDEPQWIVAQRLLSALTIPGFS